ncbi:MAG: hypothetical protein J5861_00565 [Desulfovibrio sp.]|nr:hypothetical protein [Desulfovibrio sp.]
MAFLRLERDFVLETGLCSVAASGVTASGISDLAGAAVGDLPSAPASVGTAVPEPPFSASEMAFAIFLEREERLPLDDAAVPESAVVGESEALV